jgi:undecaprenyl-diphosphatase
MPELLKAIILGLIEGLTEFLPISSTGHLIVASALLNFLPHLRDTFDIFIQLGAVVAVVAFYFPEIVRQFRSVPTNRVTQRFWVSILIAFIPAAVVGVLLRHFIKDVLFSPGVVAVSLIVGGVIMILVDRRPAKAASATDADVQSLGEVKSITFGQALIVGIAQVVSLIPGVSRSAASIIGGMLAGLDRRSATQFSFFLAIPTLGAATIFDLVSSLKSVQSTDILYIAVGTLVSGIVAWLSIRWLLRYVAGHNFVAFGFYRILAGIVILILLLVVHLPGMAG